MLTCWYVKLRIEKSLVLLRTSCNEYCIKTTSRSRDRRLAMQKYLISLQFHTSMLSASEKLGFPKPKGRFPGDN